MSETRQLCVGGGTATARKPRVLVVGIPSAGKAAEQLRKLGWDVLTVPSVDAVCPALTARRPNAVVLPVETGSESGYLMAAKLRSARRKLRLVLVGPARDAEAERFAGFVGAVYVAETDGLARLVTAVTG